MATETKTPIADQPVIQTGDLSGEEKAAQAARVKEAAKSAYSFFAPGAANRDYSLVRGLVSNWFNKVDLQSELTDDRMKILVKQSTEADFAARLEYANENADEFAQRVADYIRTMIQCGVTLNTKSVTLPGVDGGSGKQAREAAEALFNFKPSARMRNDEFGRSLAAFAGIKVA